MAQPVLVVVDDEEASLRALAHELQSRYGAHYQIVASVSAEDALTRLAELAAEGSRVPLILADQWMPGMTGAGFLTRARELHPTARRGLLVSWSDRSAAAPIVEAVALGQVDFYLPKPAWSPDEQFHRAITESLEQWWRQQGGRFEAVTVIGADPSARAHEIRDILTRNNVPFGFIRSDSSDGQAALRRLGIRQGAGPVVALYTGAVLVDPSNVEVAEALGAPVRPADRAYDVVIVGAGPAGLAAAVYGASEGLRTALLEREAFGGQAGTSSLIRNFLGFPHGVSGTELAGRAFQQAWQFGAHLIYGNPGVSLAGEGSVHVVTLQDGTEVRTRAVVIATGVSYRRLQAPGLQSLVGAGVFYGAATVEGWDICYVADHFLAGLLRGEVPLHQVGNVVLLAVALSEAEPPGPRLAGLQAQLTHQRPDQLRPGRHAPAREVRVDPPVAVRLIRISEGLLHVQREYPAPFHGR